MSVFMEKLSSILGGADTGTGEGAAGEGGAAVAGSAEAALKKLSAGLTVFSGLSDIASGFARSTELKTQAKFETFEAGNEKIRGLGRENIIRDQLFDVLAGQSVAFAANNVDLSSPVAQTARRKAVKSGERAVSAVRNQAVIASQARRFRSRQLLKAAKRESRKGFIKLGTKIATFGVGG